MKPFGKIGVLITSLTLTIAFIAFKSGALSPPTYDDLRHPKSFQFPDKRTWVNFHNGQHDTSRADSLVLYKLDSFKDHKVFTTISSSKSLVAFTKEFNFSIDSNLMKITGADSARLDSLIKVMEKK